MTPDELFAQRAGDSDARIDKLRTRAEGLLGSDWDTYGRDVTTVYVTGSAARGEASAHSDVDLFFARVGATRTSIDEAVLQSAIVRALVAEKLPLPSDDARFLRLHTADDLVQRMGEPRDDFENTFTARMLLLLESQPLLGESTYQALLDAVVGAYWKDPKGHEADYIPMVLLNDIVRYWRILLLNHAWKVGDSEASAGADVGDRRLRSYKLRFSRCLICHSAIAEMLAVYRLNGRIIRDASALARSDPPSLVKSGPRDDRDPAIAFGVGHAIAVPKRIAPGSIW